MQILVLFVLVTWVTGCATQNHLLRLKQEGKGTSKVYPVNADRAWEIAQKVLLWDGAEAIEEHRSEGYILATCGVGTVSHGTGIGVWVEPLDKVQSKVTVITRQRVITDTFQMITEASFHNSFAQTLDIMRSGPRQ